MKIKDKMVKNKDKKIKKKTIKEYDYTQEKWVVKEIK